MCSLKRVGSRVVKCTRGSLGSPTKGLFRCFVKVAQFGTRGQTQAFFATAFVSVVDNGSWLMPRQVCCAALAWG